MARPGPKPRQRISGTGYDPKTQAGASAIAQLRYKTLSEDWGTYEIDTHKIKSLVTAYIEASERAETDTETGKVTTRQEPISRVGLRVALGISRDTYSRWLQGYVSQSDIEDDGVVANTALSEAMRAGDDRILQYLVETSDKYGETKRIRLLETYGEIGPAQSRHELAGKLDLGKWAKYSK